jgi:hypothetical protein
MSGRRRKLRVYGWQGFRAGKCTREICATTSKEAAARIAGYEGKVHRLFNLGTTSNDQEIEAAMAQQGKVLWRGMNDFNGKWETA